jgi:hypothetical protein
MYRWRLLSRESGHLAAVFFAAGILRCTQMLEVVGAMGVYKTVSLI